MPHVEHPVEWIKSRQQLEDWAQNYVLPVLEPDPESRRQSIDKVHIDEEEIFPAQRWNRGLRPQHCPE